MKSIANRRRSVLLDFCRRGSIFSFRSSGRMSDQTRNCTIRRERCQWSRAGDRPLRPRTARLSRQDAQEASHLAVPTLLLWTDDWAAMSMKSTRGCGRLGAASPALEAPPWRPVHISVCTKLYVVYTGIYIYVLRLVHSAYIPDCHHTFFFSLLAAGCAVLCMENVCYHGPTTTHYPETRNN